MADIVCVRIEDSPFVNIKHQLVRHSPDGFEWGYHGSGCAELALNILLNYIPLETVDLIYQDFKREFIAIMPYEGGIIKESNIQNWIKSKEAYLFGKI